MDDEAKVKFIAQMVLLPPTTFGAPGAEHERLKAALHAWLRSHVLESTEGEFGGDRPDLLHEDPHKQRLDVGDAKDSAHETIPVDATLERIHDDFAERALRIGSGAVVVGDFVSATN